MKTWLDEKERTLFKRGIILFHDDIDSNTFERLSERLWLAKAKRIKRVTIVLATVGGALDCALGAYDLIRYLNRNGMTIDVLANGYCYSAGVILLQAGARRLATPNTVLMVHESLSLHFGKLTEIREDVKFVDRLVERVWELLCEKSKLTVQRLKDETKGKNWWLTANEALELGLIDEIVGGERFDAA